MPSGNRPRRPEGMKRTSASLLGAFRSSPHPRASRIPSSTPAAAFGCRGFGIRVRGFAADFRARRRGGPRRGCRRRVVAVALIQVMQSRSVPISTLAPRTASISCGRQGFMIADVMPEAIAIGRKAALMPCRCGRPNEMFDAPQLVLTFSSSRSRRTSVNTWRPAVPIAPIGMTSGSTTMSSGLMP